MDSWSWWINPHSFFSANALSLLLVTLSILHFWTFGFAWGLAIRSCFPILAPRQRDAPTVVAEVVTGSLLAGLGFFLLSWVFGSLKLAAFVLLLVGIVLGGCLWRRLFDVLNSLFWSITNSLRSWSLAERLALVFVGTLAALRFSDGMILQSHGDQYLYHLSIGRDWTELGTPSVISSNITSGFSWSVELVYAYFRQWVGGDTTLILWSQQFHAALSFFGTLTLCYVIMRAHLTRIWAVLLLVVFMGPRLNQMVFFAKNDGIAFLLCFLALYWSMKKRWSDLFLLAPALLTAKITAAISLVAVGLASIARAWCADGIVVARKTAGVWLAVAVLACVGIAPFLISNELQTGNPLFPIMNHVFKSPLAPATAKSLVQEMAPFQLTWTGYWVGWMNFIRDQPITIFLFVALAALFWRQRRRPLTDTALDALFFLGTAFLAMTLLQYGLQQYGVRVEQRHFKLVQYSIILAAAHCIAALPKRRLRSALLAGICLFGLFVSNAEVLVRNAWRMARIDDVKEHLMNRRPVFALLEEVSQSPDLCDRCEVLGAGFFIEPYFLKRGKLLVWSVNGDLLQAQQTAGVGGIPDILTGIHERGFLRYAVLDDSFADTPQGQWIQERMSFVKRRASFRLFASRPLD